MKPSKQTTLRKQAILSGLGVHSNAPVQLVLNPAEADTGLVFLRTGLSDGGERLIKAKWSHVTMTELCTVIGEGSQSMVATIEHLVAAMHGLGVDNCLIEVDGPEVPIMDGSAAAFVEAIETAGVVTLPSYRRYIKVLKPVRVENGRAFCELTPADQGFRLDIEIDFGAKIIGRQRKIVDLEPGVFRREIARARTFGFLSDVERLWKAGFALGSSLENSVALEDDRILNPEGLRYSDEFVRHKMLDAVGDLGLAGGSLVGCYRSYCGGHKMNVAILAALFADRGNYQIIDSTPVRREGARAELALGLSPAFMPERS